MGEVIISGEKLVEYAFIKISLMLLQNLLYALFIEPLLKQTHTTSVFIRDRYDVDRYHNLNQ